MSLKDIEQELVDDYMGRGMSEKDFDKIFKKAMNNESVRKAILDAFNDESNLYSQRKLEKQFA